LAHLVTLTTDFGSADGYQAVLEGVIAAISRSIRVVVISHDVPAGDIIGGWYLLKTHHRFFPPDTVHLAVVDPGVGSQRKIIAVQTRSAFFIAPDNGLLSFLPNREIVSIHSITNRDYSLGHISPVFHGRDIMAPAAAYLSLGVDPSCLGRRLKEMLRFSGMLPVRSRHGFVGRVVWIDRFGNLISNIETAAGKMDGTVLVEGRPIGPIRRTFSDVRPGEPVAYIGSGGHLEVAIRDGSAAEYFEVAKGCDAEILVAPSARRR
jgi:S-adenosyl-L-methionine hydrolase (adenosine-forming)